MFLEEIDKMGIFSGTSSGNMKMDIFVFFLFLLASQVEPLVFHKEDYTAYGIWNNFL